MVATDVLDNEPVIIDLDIPIDISVPITENNPTNAFGLPPATFIPFRSGIFVGSVEEGGSVRCDVVTLAPHGDGTHTECIGHIAGTRYSLLQCLKQQLVMSQLVSVNINVSKNSIDRSELERVWNTHGEKALIIRSLPNDTRKKSRTWSGTNPPFISAEAMQLIVERSIQHLLIDLPSVDAEVDGGVLEAHHIFWQWPDNPRAECTITELIYVPDEVTDGMYMVDFNAAAFDGDAAPSRPTLYRIMMQK